MIHYLTYKRPVGMRHIADFGTTVPNLQRILMLIAGVLQDVPPQVADRRIYTTAMMFCSNLVNQTKRPAGPEREDSTSFLDDLLDLLALSSVAPMPASPTAGFSDRLQIVMNGT
jgi:hypothetical protein